MNTLSGNVTRAITAALRSSCRRETGHHLCVQESRSDGLMRHFTVHSPECDVPRLLDAVRVSLVELGAVDVYDITFCAHFDGPEYVAEMTVYYWPKDEAAEGQAP
jgi:hypothetical protein